VGHSRLVPRFVPCSHANFCRKHFLRTCDRLLGRERNRCREVFAFAGIWDSWRSPEGQTVETFSIITTKPNSLIASVHDRMPVILPEDAYDLWLNPSFQRTDALCDLLQPFDARRMRGYEVSSRVNSVRNDDPACAERVETLFST